MSLTAPRSAAKDRRDLRLRRDGRSRRLSAAVLVVAIALLATAVHEAAPPARARPSAPVATGARSQARPLLTSSGGEGFVGVVVNSTSVDLGPPSSGVVESITARLGDEVKRGQVLVTLDSRELRYELAMATAQAASVDAEIERAILAREQVLGRLASAEAVAVHLSGEDLADARYDAGFAASALKALSAQQRRSAAQLDQIKARLSRRLLRAPMDSVVAGRFVDPGASVNAGTVLLRLVGRGSWRVRFAVPEGEERGVLPNQDVEVRLEGSGRSWPAIVKEVAPVLDPASLTHFAEAELEISDGGPAYGALVRVRVPDAR